MSKTTEAELRLPKWIRAIKHCEGWRDTPAHLDSDGQILCPVCGFNYVHHQSKTVVIMGRDNYEASSAVRGDVIAVPMRCEDGHAFLFCFGFHKGMTFTWYVTDPCRDYAQ